MAILTYSDQRRIDSIIEDIKLRTGFSYPEGSLLDLAKGEDINVLVADLSKVAPNVSGVIEYDNDDTKSNPRILINENISKERKLFTLAHELGHHFLHKGKKLRLDTLDYSNSDKDTKEESEANYFAASLLVPKELLEFRMSKGDSVTRLAKYFGVSLPVIENRIRWIKANQVS